MVCPDAYCVSPASSAPYFPICRSAIGGGPPFHPNCVYVLTPFVERLATEDERKRGVISPDLLNRSPAVDLSATEKGFHRMSEKC